MLILVKVKNAAELFWESLDTQERVLIAYMAATVLISVFGAAQKRSRQRLKDELRDEITREVRGGR
jgi:hypothetical protein